MITNRGPKTLNTHTRKRYLAALIISMVFHGTVYLVHSPEYKPVSDIAVQMEIVQTEEEQELAPEAEGPRNVGPEAEEPPLPEVETQPETASKGTIEEIPAPDTESLIPKDTEILADGFTDTGEEDTETDDTDSEVKLASKMPDTDTALTDSDTGTDTSAIAALSDTDTQTDLSADNSDTDTLILAEADDSDTIPDDMEDTRQRIVASRDTDRTGVDSDSDSSSAIVVAHTPASDTEQPIWVDTDTSVISAGTSERGIGSDTEETDSDQDASGNGVNKEGICLHDVFSYAKTNPSWMLWLSMKAFADSQYEKGLAQILGSFYLYDEMVSATEIDPLTELEGLLISADLFHDFHTYQVVTTYNIKEAQLKERLIKNNANNSSFTMDETNKGFSAVLPGRYRWDMVGSGRVMVAANAKQSFNHNWPDKVTCMSPRTQLSGNGDTQFNRLVRSHIGPSQSKRWPIMVLATRDPMAVGLYNKPRLAKVFQWAMVKGYFSDPIRIEGIAQFNGTPEDMVAVERMVTYILSKGSYLKYLGLGGITENVEYTISNNRLEFTVSLKEKHVHAGLLLLKTYGKRINNKFAPQPSP